MIRGGRGRNRGRGRGDMGMDDDNNGDMDNGVRLFNSVSWYCNFNKSDHPKWVNASLKCGAPRTNSFRFIRLQK